VDAARKLFACGSCGLVQDPAEMQKVGWHVAGGEALLLAICLGCKSSRTIQSYSDACLCTTCKRLVVNEVKHCVLDECGGSLILCDSCYVRDDRRNDWEHRGDVVPRRWALLGGRR
jgi:hypothetical protein